AGSIDRASFVTRLKLGAIDLEPHTAAETVQTSRATLPPPRRVYVRESLRIADSLGAHPLLAGGDQQLSFAPSAQLSAAALGDGPVEVHPQGDEPLLRRLQAAKRGALLSAAHVDSGPEQFRHGRSP